MNDVAASSLQHALEVLLFSTTEPISSYQLASLLAEQGYTAEEGSTLTPGRVEKLIEALSEAWEREGRPLTVLRIAGGFQMATRPEWSALVARLLEEKKSQRLSRAALETLAIIAYRQPVIRPDIDAIRGVNSDSSIKTLMERNLVSISGRDEGPGRPLLYRTTPDFLKTFGLNSLADLPDPKEMAALLGTLPGQTELQVAEGEEGAQEEATEAEDAPPGEGEGSKAEDTMEEPADAGPEEGEEPLQGP